MKKGKNGRRYQIAYQRHLRHPEAMNANEDQVHADSPSWYQAPVQGRKVIKQKMVVIKR
jgi:hypothetical protein